MTANAITHPGNIDKAGAILKKSLPSLIIIPQLGIGGCIPNPKKDRLASAIIAPEIPRVNEINIGPIQFGKTW